MVVGVLLSSIVFCGRTGGYVLFKLFLADLQLLGVFRPAHWGNRSMAMAVFLYDIRMGYVSFADLRFL